MPDDQKRYDRLMEPQSRSIRLKSTKIDDDERTIEAALSSETPVERWGFTEILSHDADAVDLSRAADGLPMLFNHDAGQPLGIVRDVRIDKDKRIRGTLHFSQNARASDVWPDVRDGFLRDVSIGYSIRKWEETSDGDEITVTRWQLNELSIAPVAADSTVGTLRHHTNEGQAMPNTDQGGEAARDNDDKTAPTINVRDFSEARERNLAEGKASGARAENKRVREITRIFALHERDRPDVRDLRDRCIEQTNVTVEGAQRALLDLLGAGIVPAAGGPMPQDEYNGGLDTGSAREVERSVQPYAGQVRPGEDQRDKYRNIVEKTLAVRVGTEKDAEIVREVRASEFGDMLVSEMAREFLQRNGQSVKGMNRSQLIGQAMVSRAAIAHGTSDFSNILENVANKSMLLGYSESSETWPMIARNISVPDFKPNSFVGLSEFGSLPEVEQNGEYTYGTFSDRKEFAQLATYGKLFSISRQALADDDLAALGDQPRAMGRAASRTIGDKVYAVLTSNPTLNQDGVALFDAGHNNDVAAGSGAPPSVETLNAMRVAMATQKDQASAATSLNIRMARLIVPVSLETTANILATAEWNPAEGATTSFREPNPFRGTFTPVADARLDDDDPARWYGSADPNVTDTIGACFLNGQTEPFMEEQMGFTVDGVTYKVRIDCVALALDFRALQRNDGN